MNSACYEAAYILYNCVSVLLLSFCLNAIFNTLFSNIFNCMLSLRPDTKFCTHIITAVDGIHPSYSGGQDLYLISETSYPERFLLVSLSYFRQFLGYYIKLIHYHACPHAFKLVIPK
jgi:hypothetical protein